MDIEGFLRLLEPDGRDLLGTADLSGDPLAVAARLRRSHPPELVSAALTQAGLRARAAERFGADAERMFFTPAGLEQASRAEVAAHRAVRLARAGGPVADLCCGIGADMIALARTGTRVTGVDIDPLTVEVARANLAALGLDEVADVRLGGAEAVDPAGYAAVFCDPARRTAGGATGGRGPRGRVFDPAAFSPPWPEALRLAGGARGGCVKTAPGIPHDLVPSGAEAEWVSYKGDVKEAAIWLGDLATTPSPTNWGKDFGGRPAGQPQNSFPQFGSGGGGGGVSRRATLLPSGVSLAAEPGIGDPAVSAPLRYLYEPDGAVVRAHLVAEAAAGVDGALLDPRIAYITSDRAVDSPFCARYEVLDVLPFSLKRLRSALRERRVGTVTVKKRGSAVDVEKLRRDLRAQGPESATVVLTRIGERPYAFICRPG